MRNVGENFNFGALFTSLGQGTQGFPNRRWAGTKSRRNATRMGIVLAAGAINALEDRE